MTTHSTFVIFSATLNRFRSYCTSKPFGKRPSDETLRTAISNALKYVDSFGEAIREKVEKNPFGDLRGLTSRLKMLSKEQARWIIKGVKMSSEAK